MIKFCRKVEGEERLLSNSTQPIIVSLFIIKKKYLKKGWREEKSSLNEVGIGEGKVVRKEVWEDGVPDVNDSGDGWGGLHRIPHGAPASQTGFPGYHYRQPRQLRHRSRSQGSPSCRSSPFQQPHLLSRRPPQSQRFGATFLSDQVLSTLSLFLSLSVFPFAWCIVPSIAARFDAVIHFAGLKGVGESVAKPRRYYDNNVVGTINLFQAMAKFNCKNMVISSSATVYGQPHQVPCVEEDLHLHAMNPYGRTKVAHYIYSGWI